MTLQRSHDRLYPLVSPPDELPPGQAAPEAAVSGPVKRSNDGRFASSEAARAAGRKGGLKSAQSRTSARAWGSRLGLGRLLTLTTDDRIAPFVEEATQWYQAQCTAVARDVGGGELSPGCMSILRTAAWERLYSNYLFDCATRTPFAWDGDTNRIPKVLPRTELAAAAARLGDASRQNLLAAHELAVREAASRPRPVVDALQRIRAMAASAESSDEPDDVEESDEDQADATDMTDEKGGA
jgi:hypothetical protein